MLNIFKKKKLNGEEIILKIEGMHCVACSLNIDDTLEEIDGVYESQTSYAKGETKVKVNKEKVALENLVQKITELGYGVTK